ncbi:MAG: hypothetical protein C5B58_08280 [Acidobacteria bacterium]|nr:MAG: hypothetical protein C5B58_08280 [Acidobacteriota bacterium]
MPMRFYRGYAWQRVILERFTEPMHLNAISLLVKLFGSFRAKVTFDLTPRRAYAYGVLEAAERARALGLKCITVAEFGVASGGGLLAMCQLARQAKKETGVDFQIVGFDTGTGLPPPADYRDHPDLFQHGDYSMPDQGRLRKSLPPNAHLALGQIADTAAEFTEELDPTSPLAFIAVDVDYYSSAKDVLNVMEHKDPRKYLPLSLVYFDDIQDPRCNSWCGELLAISEFNGTHPMRKIERHRFLRTRRIIKSAAWIDQMYNFHVLDHPFRRSSNKSRGNIQVANPYLGIGRVDH